MRIGHKLYLFSIVNVALCAFQFGCTAWQMIDVTLIWASGLGALLATIEGAA